MYIQIACTDPVCVCVCGTNSIRSLVWGNSPAPQTSTGEIFHGSHANMHERAEVEEHVVEGMDREASSLVSIFQRYNGRVQRVGQISEARTACFNHFLGTLLKEKK